MSATARRLVSTIRLWSARRRRGGEAAQQRAQALVLELARLRSRPMLQRLDAVEHEQHAARHQRFGDRLALGGGAGRLELHAELVQRPIEKFVRRGRALLRALAVERPAEHAFRAAIAVGAQALQPFVDQSRLARPAFGDEREDVGLAVAPGLVEALKLRVAPDQPLVAGFGQAGDGDQGRSAPAAGRIGAIPSISKLRRPGGCRASARQDLRRSAGLAICAFSAAAAAFLSSIALAKSGDLVGGLRHLPGCARLG